MEPRLISLVINMAVNSTQRLQIFPSVYHFSHCEFNVLSELVILGGGGGCLNSQNIMSQLHHSICHLRSQFPERFG